MRKRRWLKLLAPVGVSIRPTYPEGMVCMFQHPLMNTNKGTTSTTEGKR